MASVVRIIPKSTAGVTSANRVTADYLHSTLVINSTGVTLPAGMAVYAQQSDCGCFCEIYPADPRFDEKSVILGILPTNVFTGKTTRVAVGGTVPYLLAPGVDNPIGGTLLYLDDTNPGYLNTSAPGDAASVVEVGTVAAGKLVMNINRVLAAGDDINAGGGLILDLDDEGDVGGGLNLDL